MFGDIVLKVDAERFEEALENLKRECAASRRIRSSPPTTSTSW